MPYREDIPGYMPRKDLEIIEALSQCVTEKGTVVEIGSYFGRSSWAWAKSVPPSATVYCIDPWPASPFVRGIFDASFEDFSNTIKDCPNIIPIQGFSPYIPWSKDRLADVIFIDGNHKKPHVNNDIEFWSEMLTKTGILCGHDFNPYKYPDVCEAVISLSYLNNWPFRIFQDSTIWYFEKHKENFSIKNKKMISQRLVLETMSWQPDAKQIEVVRKIYKKV